MLTISIYSVIAQQVPWQQQNGDMPTARAFHTMVEINDTVYPFTENIIRVESSKVIQQIEVFDCNRRTVQIQQPYKVNNWFKRKTNKIVL